MPHALTSRSNGDSFTYDANGNMITRTMGTSTWNQTFDAENHLVSVSDGATTTQYVYDGNGNRVKRIVGDTTTLYVAGMEIEFHASSVKATVYYAQGGAFRVYGGDDPGLYFRHTDHLGSTSVISNAVGGRVPGSDIVYAPFGEMRAPTDLARLTRLTDFTFTGQRLDRDSGGLMFYNARYYLPGIGRFISPDTIVPNPADSQSFNRFSYTLNNPIKHTDPSGHCIDDDGDHVCSAAERHETIIAPLIAGTGISFDGTWTLEQELKVLRAAHTTIDALKEADLASARQQAHLSGRNVEDHCLLCNMSSGQAWNAVFGNLTMKRVSDTELQPYIMVEGKKVYYGAQSFGDKHTIEFYNAAFGNNYGLGFQTQNIIHEFAHMLDYRAQRQPNKDVDAANVVVDGSTVFGGSTRKGLGYQPGITETTNLPWRQSSQEYASEELADMYMNWTLQSFAGNAYGAARNNWMNDHIPGWIALTVSRN